MDKKEKMVELVVNIVGVGITILFIPFIFWFLFYFIWII